MPQSITPSTSANPVSAAVAPARRIVISVSALVDKLVSIRDEVTGGVAPAWIAAGIWKLIHEVETAPEAFPALPPISGGGPVACDDFEELCEEFQADPAGWPSYPDPEVDGHRWEPNTFEGSTPLSVLEASAPEEHRTFSPSAADWEYLFSAGRDGLVTEHDLAAAGLAVG